LPLFGLSVYKNIIFLFIIFLVKAEVQPNYEEIVQRLDGYTRDGRWPIWKLYKAASRLEKEFGWNKKTVFTQVAETPQGLFSLPIDIYMTPHAGPAFWVIAGVHGEEVAGSIAVAKGVEEIASLGKKIPMVVAPLGNPFGYFRDFRYPNEKRDKEKGQSVGDAEHLLPDLSSTVLAPRQPLISKISREACALTKEFASLLVCYPPVILMDHHGDEHQEAPYIYSQGQLGEEDPVAQDVIRILKQFGIPINGDSETEFHQQIINGIVSDKFDGSLEELIGGAGERIINGRRVTSQPCFTVIVVETPTLLVSLEAQIAAHLAIVRSYPKYWQWVLEKIRLSSNRL